MPYIYWLNSIQCFFFLGVFKSPPSQGTIHSKQLYSVRTEVSTRKKKTFNFALLESTQYSLYIYIYICSSFQSKPLEHQLFGIEERRASCAQISQMGRIFFEWSFFWGQGGVTHVNVFFFCSYMNVLEFIHRWIAIRWCY